MRDSTPFAYSSRSRRSMALVVAVLLSVSTGPAAWAQETAQPSQGQTRTEKDLLGEKQIPADAYYGVQTSSALENFQLSASRSTTTPDLSRPGRCEARGGAG